MERQDYPAMLPQLQPSQAVDVLNDRVRQVGRLNTAIADWLSARRQIEEQYAAGLRRLAQRTLDAGDLGIFSGPWTTIAGSADVMADAHASLAARIEIEIEQPLRDFATTNREMKGMSNIQGNLTALAKELEKAQQKADKLKGKGERPESNRSASASTEVDNAQAQWDSQAPYVFENLQALDETRFNHLRDLLTQFETMETDQLEKTRQSAEQCLNVLLNVQTEDEIKTFALRTTQARPSLSRSQRPSVATPSRGASAAAATNLTPATSRVDDERRSTRSGSVAEATPEEKPKSKFGGLKRFGTVISKRRESRIPANFSATSESPDRKTKSSPFGRLGRSKDSTPNLAPLDENQATQRPGSPLRLGSEIFQSPSEREVDPLSAAGAATQSIPTNGVSPSAATSLPLPNGSHQGELADLDPPKPSQPIAPSSSEPRRDSEGFSVPPANLDPITQAQLEAGMTGDGSTPQFNVNIRDAPIQEDSTDSDAAFANVANKLQAPPPTARRSNTVRGRRGDRNSSVINSIFIPSEQQIAELGPDSSGVVMSQPTQPAPLQSTAPSSAVSQDPQSASSLGGVAAGAAGVAGAAAIAGTAFAPSSSQTEASSSPLRSELRTAAGGELSRGDSYSIRSATTSGSLGGAKHPELVETGLNSSIIETVGARFENGNITSSTLIGEIALAYNAADFSSPFGSETIRLDNFSILEKVAPNPAFINQIPDREGEYAVNLASIGRTQVAFKYQVRLSDERSHAPLLLTPVFRIEPNQASIIVSYSLNPAFARDAEQPLTLNNVMIALTLEGARASSCQSKPVGVFARERNMIFWQLNNITLTPGAAPEKLLARFATDAEAKSGSVEAKWEIVGEAGVNVGSGLSVSVQSSAAATDPFADESAGSLNKWKTTAGAKKVVSGLYVAK